MTNHDRDLDQDQDLRDLLGERAKVRPEELEPVREFVANLPTRRRRRSRGLLAAAAGIVVLLGFAGLVVSQIPFGTSGAAPDSRLAACGVTPDDAVAIFPMTHLRDYPFHLPAARPLETPGADPDAPALVIVLRGSGSAGSAGETAVPGRRDLCIVVGTGEQPWTRIDVAAVDTTGMIEDLPEPAGTPVAVELVPWVERCGGSGAGILDVVRLVEGADLASLIGLEPVPAELAAAPAATVVVYDAGHPFPPLATPPPGASSPLPRNPLAPGHHDLCVLVGADPATAQRFIHEDVVVGFPSAALTPAPATESPSASGLPAQVDPAQCAAMSFAPDRCLAVVEAARQQASLAWADIVRVTIAKAPADVSLGSYPVAAVTFQVGAGSSVDQTVRCLGLGGQYSLVCTDNPEILLTSPTMGGYRDVPCGATPGGEPGSACASPMPTIDPAAAAKAVPLEIASRDIPITTTGQLEIDLGSATLPNGILTDARFALADKYTRTFTVGDGIRLVVRSLDPTRPPFDNIYAHGWYPGTEAVEVYLILDVTSFTPGATLQVRDLVVR